MIMAVLVSEDTEVISSLELQCLGRIPATDHGLRTTDQQDWFRYRLELLAGPHQLLLESNPRAPDDRCCLLQQDIVACWSGLRALADGRRSRFLFEPVEPCFQLQLDPRQEGYRVFVWIDAGNQLYSHYAWDAVGVRFFTDTARLRSFIGDLEYELAGHGIQLVV